MFSKFFVANHLNNVYIFYIFYTIILFIHYVGDCVIAFNIKNIVYDAR